MYGILPAFVKLWLVFTSVVCSIDALFLMLRPLSLKHRLFAKFFSLWVIYADVDLHYGTSNDLMTHMLERLMWVEISLNFVALLMDLFCSRHTLLTTFTTTVMVLWKTIVFFAFYVDVPEGNPSPFPENVELLRVVLIFWMPNLIWVAAPLYVIVVLWKMMLPKEDEAPPKYCLSVQHPA
ncbi:hypothetical protein DdX_21498 [Ditylenchus destructor]|uniref:EXPERA domain-containing protein n=1 Tax=Ditylenchus destructor TaxID=166010 RepID=A0AAD4MJ00_9BILA|nr:hypothetical protein DdX_21498 [Ditylenchus destructor]